MTDESACTLDRVTAVLALPHQIDWGDFPTWISAVSSAVALAAAITAAVVARRLFLLESRRDQATSDERRAREDEARQGQASQVSAWWAWDEEFATFGNQRDAIGWRFYIRNTSDLPVYQVSVTLLRPNTQSDYAEEGSGTIAVIPPGETAASQPGLPWLEELDEDEHATLLPAIKFRDAAGRWWQRDATGVLAPASA